MKKYFFTAVLIAACLAVSCSSNDPENTILPDTSGEFIQTVPAARKTATATFTASSDWSISRVGNQAWINTDKSGGPSGKNTVTFTLEENTGAERSETFRISCGGAIADIKITQQKYEEPQKTKRIHKLVWGESLWVYDYDARGRVASIMVDDDAYGFVYEEGKITETCGTRITIYELNGQGNVKKVSVERDGEPDGVTVFEYDASGYIKSQYIDSDGHRVTITYVWENGNMKSISDKDADMTYYTYTEDYTYSAHENKQNLDLHVLLGEMVKDSWFGDYFGKRSRNLLSTLAWANVYSGGEEPNTNGTIAYRYEPDSEGDVEKIYRKDGSDEEELYLTVIYKLFD